MAGCVIASGFTTEAEEMPTERPRLTITLTPEVDRALNDFARLTGQSKSSFIVDLLTGAVPQLHKMAVFIQQAEAMKADAKKAAFVRMSSYSDAIVQQASSVIRNADLFLESAMPPAGTACGKRAVASAQAGPAGAGASDVRPPHPNRGGRQGEKGGKVVKLGVRRGA